MMREVSSDHPIRRFFAEALHESLSGKLGLQNAEDCERYLGEMLVNFLHHDGLYAIRDAEGRRVVAVTDMLVEGDVRLNADSFAREREVHQHIGDFLLFWSGVFPEFLKHLKAPLAKDALLDPIRQGQYSYYVASTFDHGDYADQAPVLRRLSEEFEAFRDGLGMLRTSFEGFARGGFQA